MGGIRGPNRFKETELRRIIRSAKSEGMKVRGIEHIDGTLRVLLGDDGDDGEKRRVMQHEARK
jgi:hypothetical protein